MLVAPDRFMNYRYEHFTPRVVLEELRAIPRALPIGAPLPHFVRPTADGGAFDSATVIGTKPAVLTFASFT